LVSTSIVGDFALLTLLRICGKKTSSHPHGSPHHTNICAVLLGQATWTAKMFEELPGLDQRNPQHIPQTLTNYLMAVVITHSGLPIPYLYGGSATATTPCENGYIALRAHIGNAHEGIIGLGNE
jgi:hypothetical protein